jgi:hypothetical protein
MTKKELIEKLAKYPDDMPIGVLYYDPDDGSDIAVDPADVISVTDIPDREYITDATEGIVITCSRKLFGV